MESYKKIISCAYSTTCNKKGFVLIIINNVGYKPLIVKYKAQGYYGGYKKYI